MDVFEALKKVQELGADLQRSVKEMIPVCESPELAEQGISLLSLKYATLMRYNLNLVKLAQDRINGRDIGTIAKLLVEDGVALSKIRPVEKKLQHQIDRLLKAAASRSTAGDDDGDRHRPDPSAIVLDDDEDDGDAESNVYRPPRIAEVVYDGENKKRKDRDEKEKERFQARAIRSEGVREMLAEIKGRPEEIRDDGGEGNMSRAVRQMVREDDKKRRFEEENFVRLNLSKEDKKRRKQLEKSSQGPALDGSDEFAGLVSVANRVIEGKGAKGRRRERNGTDEEDEAHKVRQLDQITEEINGGSSKSKKKRRRR